MTTDKLIKDRGERYGKFGGNAQISQELKTILLSTLAYNKTFQSLEEEDHDVIHEALEMICHKLSRIVNGDPKYTDSWSDIAGYAELVVKEIEKNWKPIGLSKEAISLKEVNPVPGKSYFLVNKKTHLGAMLYWPSLEIPYWIVSRSKWSARYKDIEDVKSLYWVLGCEQ